MKTFEKFTKTKLFLIGFGVTMITFTSGCSKNSPLNPAGNCFDGNWAESYSTKLQEWSDASTAYSDNPTPANCDSSKKAGKAYLDAVADFYECIPLGAKSEIDQELKDAKAEIDSESCDG